jgi:hypothetical protein
MPQGDITTLWKSVSAGTLSGRFLSGADATVNLSASVAGPRNFAGCQC